MDPSRFKTGAGKPPKQPNTGSGSMSSDKKRRPLFGTKPAKATLQPQVVTPTKAGAVNPSTEDDDLFGIWETQRRLKKQRRDAEIAKRAEKRAAKIVKQRQKAMRKAQAEVTGVHEFAIKLSVPKVKGFNPKLLARTKAARHVAANKKPYAIAALALAVPLTFVAIGIVNHHPSKKGITTVEGAAVAKPDFKALAPTVAPSQATSPLYDPNKRVVSYNDVLDGTPITISEQPLPSSFVSDPTGSVEKLATQINATTKISTSDTTAFSGMSAKGPETVVFTKNDLLVFIYADKKIDTLSWSKYIDSMK